MDIIVGRTSAVHNYPSSTSAGNLSDSQRMKSSVDGKQELPEEHAKPGAQSEEELTEEEVNEVTSGLNKFLEYLEADLHFKIHEGTERMMVQLVSKKDQKVIKEMPPQELLDTIAAIQDHVGMLLDKRV